MSITELLTAASFSGGFPLTDEGTTKSREAWEVLCQLLPEVICKKEWTDIISNSLLVGNLVEHFTLHSAFWEQLRLTFCETTCLPTFFPLSNTISLNFSTGFSCEYSFNKSFAKEISYEKAKYILQNRSKSFCKAESTIYSGSYFLTLHLIKPEGILIHIF